MLEQLLVVLVESEFRNRISNQDSIRLRHGFIGLDDVCLNGAVLNFGRCELQADVPEFYSLSKVAMMLELKGAVLHIVELGDQMTEDSYIEMVLRKVLREQLGIIDVNLDTDLIRLDPDFPTDELLMDAMEECGFRVRVPRYDHWSGTLGGLVSILARERKSER